MRVTASQINCIPGDVEINLRSMLEAIDRAARNGSDIITLPEMSDTGYDMNLIKICAQTWDEGPLLALQEKAYKRKINIIAGISEKEEEKIFNTIVCLGRTGEILAKYRKTHLITAEPMVEHHTITPGDDLINVEIDGCNIGLMTCYDIRFPEIARLLTLRGAQILFLPSAFPLVRLKHWQVLTAARAIENQVFLVAPNRIGTDAGVSFCGTTTIYDPYGAVLASSSEVHVTDVTADLDITMLSTVRQQIKVYQDRRPELYDVPRKLDRGIR